MKIDKSWYIKPKDPNFPFALSAGGVVIRKAGKRLLTALLKDKKFEDYLLPKGGAEKGENLEATARREISEETGLNDLNMVCDLGIKERLTFEKKEWRTTHYFLFVTDQESGTQNLQAGEEDYIIEWFDFDKLPSMFWPEQKDLIEENRELIKKLLEEI
jgi:8-oxo-dGTP pyrophosphatase MutT (NUDIX family)